MHTPIGFIWSKRVKWSLFRKKKNPFFSQAFLMLKGIYGWEGTQGEEVSAAEKLQRLILPFAPDAKRAERC